MRLRDSKEVDSISSSVYRCSAGPHTIYDSQPWTDTLGATGTIAVERGLSAVSGDGGVDKLSRHTLCIRGENYCGGCAGRGAIGTIVARQSRYKRRF